MAFTGVGVFGGCENGTVKAEKSPLSKGVCREKKVIGVGHLCALLARHVRAVIAGRITVITVDPFVTT